MFLLFHLLLSSSQLIILCDKCVFCECFSTKATIHFHVQHVFCLFLFVIPSRVQDLTSVQIGLWKKKTQPNIKDENICSNCAGRIL